MSTLDTAISLVAQKFEGGYDKGGQPYVLHCLTVMNTVMQKYPDDEELAMIAVMHDLVEDTDVSIYDLNCMGFSHRVCQGVLDMTHNANLGYDQYIEHISHNKDAIKVKMADLEHNSQIFRMKGLRDKDLTRIAKYHKAYDTLRKALNN